MNSIISLIIPCYNSELYIHRCLDCILAQTLRKNIELILVNDGSTDRTHNIILSYQEPLNQNLFAFHYVLQENTGVGGAVNTALKLFTGEFLALLDADDYMMPDAIEKRAVWLAKHPDYSVVLNNGYYVTKETFFHDQKPFYTTAPACTESAFLDLLDGKFNSWSGTYMIRASVWLNRCPDRTIYPSRYGQNMQMLLPAVYQQKIGFLDEPLMRYLVQENSLSHFSDDKSGLKNFQATYRYQDIYEHVLSSICTESDKESMLRRIRVSSANTRFGISAKARNRDLMKIAVKELKDDGAYTLNARISYYSLWNPPVAFLLRIIRKIKSILTVRG